MTYLGAGLLGGFIALIGALLLVIDQRRDTKRLRELSDGSLLHYGLWDDCDGEPMNAYAEEYERRHGLAANPSTGI